MSHCFRYGKNRLYCSFYRSSLVFLAAELTPHGKGQSCLEKEHFIIIPDVLQQQAEIRCTFQEKKCHLRLIDHRMDFVPEASSRTHFELILHNIEDITAQIQT